MLLISQNLSRYEKIPQDAVVRINLAWVDSIKSLEDQISKFPNLIFLDLPIGRTKPPNNTYSVDEIKEVILNNTNVKYLAISNVESSADIKSYVDLFKGTLQIVPKIESKKGIDNISEIVSILGSEPCIMLDHDDLFLDLTNLNISTSDFFPIIEILASFCDKNNVKLLRTRGVVFSDQDSYNYEN